MFRSGRMRPADGPSNGSATLSRIRSLVDYTIAMLESGFRKRREGCTAHALLHFTCSAQASAERFTPGREFNYGR